MTLLTAAAPTTYEVQIRLIELGYDPGRPDGHDGPKTRAAVADFQANNELDINGIVGPKTVAKLFPNAVTYKSSEPQGTLFDNGSHKRFLLAHRALQTVLAEARNEIEFQILDSQRGRQAQETAFNLGHSKVHFGHSAHNWSPALATDLAPLKIDWNNRQPFVEICRTVVRVARKLTVPVRWLGDPNGDGNIADGWDFPHIELHPWREFAKDCRLYGG